MTPCPLTPRQIQILELVNDHSNAEIAVKLEISLSTVTNHLSVIYAHVLGPSYQTRLKRKAAYSEATDKGWIEKERDKGVNLR